MYKKTSVLLLLVFGLASSLYAMNGLDSLFLELDKELQLKEKYDREKQNYTYNLKVLLRTSVLSIEQKIDIYNQLIDAYKPYNFDSTLKYIEINIKLQDSTNNKKLVTSGQLDQSYILAISGRYIEALNVLNQIDYPTIERGLKIEYLLILEQIYSDLVLYASSEEASEEYIELSNNCTDSLFALLDENSDLYLSIKEKYLRDNRSLDMCEELNSRRLALVHMGTREYSLVTFERSLIYELRKMPDLEKKFLILSAISDIKASVKDNASLTRLALLLYQEGEIERAYRYIKISFDDAKFFNSRLRFLSISSVLPLITDAYQQKSDSQNKKLRVFSIVISLLLLMLFLVMLIIRKQKQKLSLAQAELSEANQQYKSINEHLKVTNQELKELNKAFAEASQVKEHYIGSFLAICSEYIDKLDGYRKMVNKHIRDKKIEELYVKTKNSDLVEREMKEFYDNFDSTFLHIFPDFVVEINKLLVEEYKINLSDPAKLNTELRIFALIRLGISDSSSIAKLLRYSVNTIYNYRVKLRNAALVPREKFKEYVLKIGASE